MVKPCQPAWRLPWQPGERLRALPGTVRAVIESLHRAWMADLDLRALAPRGSCFEKTPPNATKEGASFSHEIAKHGVAVFQKCIAHKCYGLRIGSLDYR